jgi:hypothetical protein
VTAVAQCRLTCAVKTLNVKYNSILFLLLVWFVNAIAVSKRLHACRAYSELSSSADLNRLQA